MRGLTAQEVGNIHLAKAVDIDLAADQFINTGHRTEWYPLQPADICHGADDFSASAWYGDDHLIHPLVFEYLAHIVKSADHRHARDLLFLFGGVVIQEPDRLHIQLRVLLQFLDHKSSGISCPDDQSLAQLTTYSHT